MSSESDVELLLEAAERECRQKGHSVGFREEVLRQFLLQTSSVAIRLWEVRDPSSVTCCEKAGETAPLPSNEELVGAGSGVVDHTQGFGSTGVGELQRLLTASQVVDDVRVVLELVTHQVSTARDLMEPLCEVLADLHRRLLLGHMVGRERQLLQALDLIALLHTDLNRERVTNTLASDAAAVFGCRRASVCRRDSRGQWGLVSATAVTDPNHRADAVRNIGLLVREEEEKARAAESDTENGTNPNAAAGTASEDVSDEIILPLTVNRSWKDAGWAVVFETDDAESIDRLTLNWVCQHASVAIRNCDRLTESALLRRMARLPRALLTTQPLIVIALLAIATTLFLIGKTEFRIEAFGQVMPVDRAQIFTPDAGIISAVHVAEGDTVKAQQELFELRNEEIELELESVNGDLAAAEARLAALESLRGTYGSERNALLSGEEAELSARVASLKRQSAILELRHENLIVRSEIDGKVYGDFIQEHLLGRPVLRGQFLFDVADPASEWQLYLSVPEADIRHVLEADRFSDTALKITYTLETNPEATHTTDVDDIGRAVEIDEQGRLTTRVMAGIADVPSRTERPGAGVIAHIHCGQRSRGYVYFRRVIEFIERQVFF